eukprot:CAMPEP_0206540684 /NCGR_PEP_ID=MMETSP0325_2-20121206/9152_1 /ASSEMBLY_ACC=CAM_ASM_000347 /TAXON_ID=2866 /ORGANISM="Crypthecodinium cohnii, Strain Seligo" /LENGTH=1109 /DNA_ID=CAMNT_0054038455 /DNA_START=43 /DNA_END=3372 /DNA_ORIENTATION=-
MRSNDSRNVDALKVYDEFVGELWNLRSRLSVMAGLDAMKRNELEPIKEGSLRIRDMVRWHRLTGDPDENEEEFVKQLMQLCFLAWSSCEPKSTGSPLLQACIGRAEHVEELVTGLKTMTASNGNAGPNKRKMDLLEMQVDQLRDELAESEDRVREFESQVNVLTEQLNETECVREELIQVQQSLSTQRRESSSQAEASHVLQDKLAALSLDLQKAEETSRNAEARMKDMSAALDAKIEQYRTMEKELSDVQRKFEVESEKLKAVEQAVKDRETEDAKMHKKLAEKIVRLERSSTSMLVQAAALAATTSQSSSSLPSTTSPSPKPVPELRQVVTSSPPPLATLEPSLASATAPTPMPTPAAPSQSQLQSASIVQTASALPDVLLAASTKEQEDVCLSPVMSTTTTRGSRRVLGAAGRRGKIEQEKAKNLDALSFARMAMVASRASSNQEEDVMNILSTRSMVSNQEEETRSTKSNASMASIHRNLQAYSAWTCVFESQREQQVQATAQKMDDLTHRVEEEEKHAHLAQKTIEALKLEVEKVRQEGLAAVALLGEATSRAESASAEAAAAKAQLAAREAEAQAASTEARKALEAASKKEKADAGVLKQLLGRLQHLEQSLPGESLASTVASAAAAAAAKDAKDAGCHCKADASMLLEEDVASVLVVADAVMQRIEDKVEGTKLAEADCGGTGGEQGRSHDLEELQKRYQGLEEELGTVQRSEAILREQVAQLNATLRILRAARGTTKEHLARVEAAYLEELRHEVEKRENPETPAALHGLLATLQAHSNNLLTWLWGVEGQPAEETTNEKEIKSTDPSVLNNPEVQRTTPTSTSITSPPPLLSLPGQVVSDTACETAGVAKTIAVTSPTLTDEPVVGPLATSILTTAGTTSAAPSCKKTPTMTNETSAAGTEPKKVGGLRVTVIQEPVEQDEDDDDDNENENEDEDGDDRVRPKHSHAMTLFAEEQELDGKNRNQTHAKTLFEEEIKAGLPPPQQQQQQQQQQQKTRQKSVRLDANSVENEEEGDEDDDDDDEEGDDRAEVRAARTHARTLFAPADEDPESLTSEDGVGVVHPLRSKAKTLLGEDDGSKAIAALKPAALRTKSEIEGLLQM